MNVFIFITPLLHDSIMQLTFSFYVNSPFRFSKDILLETYDPLDTCGSRGTYDEFRHRHLEAKENMRRPDNTRGA